MRYAVTGIFLVLVILLSDFAVSNLGNVTLTLWPLDIAMAAPLFLITLVMLGLGFGIGWTAAWLAAGKHRREKRRHARRVAELESELATARTASLPGRSLTATQLPAV